jgi:hypothetical protein
MELLRAPLRADKGPHFDVAQKLEMLPAGWIHVGSRCDVPRCAEYKAHCGNTYVWVNSDGMQGLSEFTLIVLDISTIDLSVFRFKPTSVTVKRTKVDGKRVTEQWDAIQDPMPECDECRHQCDLPPIIVTRAKEGRFPKVSISDETKAFRVEAPSREESGGEQVQTTQMRSSAR